MLGIRGRWQEGQCGGIPDLGGNAEVVNSDGMPTVLHRVALPRDRTYVQVQSFGLSSYALDENGKVWIWGRYFSHFFFFLLSILYNSIYRGMFAPILAPELRDHVITRIAADGPFLMVVAGNMPARIDVDDKSTMLREEARL